RWSCRRSWHNSLDLGARQRRTARRRHRPVNLGRLSGTAADPEPAPVPSPPERQPMTAANCRSAGAPMPKRGRVLALGLTNQSEKLKCRDDVVDGMVRAGREEWLDHRSGTVKSELLASRAARRSDLRSLRHPKCNVRAVVDAEVAPETGRAALH